MPVLCPDPPAPSPPSNLATTALPTSEVPWPSAPDHPVPSCPDSESGIEDSAEIEGGNMPLSPPIPIPNQRRSSLQNFHTQVSTPTQEDKSSSAPAAAQESDPVQVRSSTPNPQAGSEDIQEQVNGVVEDENCVPTIHISEDACAGENGLDVSAVPPVPKNGGIDSETSEQVGMENPKTPSSPAKSPQHHTPLNASPQPNDGLPTDMSDTTDSEPDSKISSLASGEIVVCPNLSSHHQGREIINTVYSLPVDAVFTLLFTNSKFMLDLYTARKTTDVIASPWQSNPETNQKLRQVTYTLALPPNSFGPKVSHVTETQVVSPFSKHGEIYTVDAEACNAGIPYADSFFVSNHWCLTRESATETRLSVWSQVKYKKNVWGFMKGVIDKNAYSGVESLLNDINAALLAEVDRTNLKRTRRRRRRVGSKGEPPDVLLPSQVYPDKVKDIHKATQIPARKLTLPTVAADSTSFSNEGPVRLVVLILIVVLILNALLYYKLWALEDKMFHRSTPYPALDPAIFRSGRSGASIEEWLRILQQQEALHAAEVERWRRSIEEAAGFLRKAEESLRSLHSSIPPHHASRLQLLLKQIQNLHEAESQRRSSSESSHWSQPSSAETPPKGSTSTEEPSSDRVIQGEL